MFEVKCLKDSQYEIIDSTVVVDKAKAIILDVSDEEVNFSNIMTESLLYSIISRIVAGVFVKSNKELFDKYPYITINTKVDDHVLVCTVGVLDNEEEQVVINGVLTV